MPITQITSLSQFNGILEKKNGVVVVDYYATWCGPCKVIAPAYEKLSNEYRQAHFLKCDVDQCQDVSSSQGVRAMPTFMIYKNGSKVDTVMGANARELENKIRTHAGPASTDASSTHVWGAGQTLGSETQASQPINANPTEQFTSAANGIVTKFQAMDPGMKLLLGLVALYILYVFVF